MSLSYAKKECIQVMQFVYIDTMLLNLLEFKFIHNESLINTQWEFN